MIPGWEAAQLGSLEAVNRLSGVPAIVLEVICLAESGGEGGFINPEGFGGFFGLSDESIAAAVLGNSSPTAFALQAVVAAKIFAHLLTAEDGHVWDAEIAYQGGAMEGATLMQQNGVPEVIPWPPGSPPAPPAPTSKEDTMQLFIRDPDSQECGLVQGGRAINLGDTWPAYVDAYKALGLPMLLVETVGVFDPYDGVTIQATQAQKEEAEPTSLAPIGTHFAPTAQVGQVVGEDGNWHVAPVVDSPAAVSPEPATTDEPAADAPKVEGY